MDAIKIRYRLTRDTALRLGLTTAGDGDWPVSPALAAALAANAALRRASEHRLDLEGAPSDDVILAALRAVVAASTDSYERAVTAYLADPVDYLEQRIANDPRVVEAHSVWVDAQRSLARARIAQLEAATALSDLVGLPYPRGSHGLDAELDAAEVSVIARLTRPQDAIDSVGIVHESMGIVRATADGPLCLGWSGHVYVQARRLPGATVAAATELRDTRQAKYAEQAERARQAERTQVLAWLREHDAPGHVVDRYEAGVLAQSELTTTIEALCAVLAGVAVAEPLPSPTAPCEVADRHRSSVRIEEDTNATAGAWRVYDTLRDTVRARGYEVSDLQRVIRACEREGCDASVQRYEADVTVPGPCGPVEIAVEI